jgi:hypothetical protein
MQTNNHHSVIHVSPMAADTASRSVRAGNMDPDGKPVWKRNRNMQVLEILSFVSSQ